MDWNEIKQKGITKVRLPEWNSLAYLELDRLKNGKYGPWTHLHDPAVTNEVFDLLWTQTVIHRADWEEYIENEAKTIS